MKEDVEGDAGHEKSHRDNPLLNGVRAKIPYLELFDEKISALKVVQSEI